jgi:tripartite-type tricarboxylate transporter receptor subunit TctC
MQLRLVFSLIAAFACCLGTIFPAEAQDFYKGKTLTITVGFSAGGGFDVTARTLARSIGRHIPGTPNVVVVNMPGAASAISVLYLDANAPKDGTVIDTFNFGLISASLLQPDQTRVDLRKYAWIGSISADLTVCYVWKSVGPASITEMKKHGPLHFGIDGIGTSEDINERILKTILGVDISQVGGYAGTAEVRLAIERGEIDGDCGAWSSVPDDWIKQNKINPVSRSGPALPEGLSPDVPYVADIAPDDRARQIINLLVSSGQVGRPFIASLAVPQDRLKLLREAFDATMSDPDFTADLKQQRLPLSPKSADEALATVQGIYNTPPDIVAAAKRIIAE